METSIVTTPSKALRMLWQSGFFRTKQVYAKIEEALGGMDYHFPPAGLLMALRRAKFLYRSGKHGAYEYIQIHPYVDDARK